MKLPILQHCIFKYLLCPLIEKLDVGKFFITISLLLISIGNSFSQVGISNTSITPDASSILEFRSSSGGFLPPRMTTAQRNVISSPATGLFIFNTDTNQLNYYTGTSWQIISGGTAVTSLNSNTGALTMDTNYISSFSTKVRSLVSGTVPITYSNGSIGITQATTSSNGYLSSTDWNTFKNKQNQLNGTGLVQASGTSISYVPVLPISSGGTNSSSPLNNNRIMVSSGGSIVEGSALTNGQLLIGSSGGAPVAANLTAGNGIGITNASGSITITNTKPQYKTLVTSASSDILLTTTTITDITGLSFNAAANTTYHIHAIIAFTSTDGGTGMDVGCNGPASPSFVAFQGNSSKNSNTSFSFNETGYNQPSSQVSNASTVGNNIAILDGIISNGGTSGTIIIRVHASKASKITVNTSLCSLEYW